jgi:RNA polymerase sigma factor (sigma-70 family)
LEATSRWHLVCSASASGSPQRPKITTRRIITNFTPEPLWVCVNLYGLWWQYTCDDPYSRWKAAGVTGTLMAAAHARDDDASIIASSRDCPEQFEALFDRYAALVFRYASARLGPDLAQDLVGETFLRAFAARGRYDLDRVDARPWLLGIATKLIGRHRRAEAARLRTLAAVEGRAAVDTVTPCPADAVAVSVSAQACRGVLSQALGDLAGRDRDVLLLIAWGVSYADAARELGVPVGTVRSRLNRARRKVREALGDSDLLNSEVL